MKKKLTLILVVTCMIIIMTTLVACNGGRQELASVVDAGAYDYDYYNTKEYVAINDGINTVGSQLTEGLYATSDKNDNVALSPLSIYMALCLIAECANDEERMAIQEVLGYPYDVIKNNFYMLYDNLSRTTKDDVGKINSALMLTNSIWLDKDVAFNQNTIDDLAKYYYCHSFSTKFSSDNKGANKGIRDFIKKSTKGLIDKNFNLGSDTLFAIINTLYLKDIWEQDGSNISITEDEYDFVGSDNTTQSVHLMEGEYMVGQTFVADTFDSFYVTTLHGYKIKFLLPKSGYTLDDVMTSDNIMKANSIKDYGGRDDVNMKMYYTRCLFPEYTAGYSGDIAGVIADYLGLDMPSKLSRLTDCQLVKSKVLHETSLTVNRKGIEGAAATVFPGCGAKGPSEYEEVYCDLVIDRTFGFIITDQNDTMIFTGCVNKI